MKILNKILIRAAVLFAAAILLSSGSYAQEDRSVADLRKDIENMDLISKEYLEIHDMRSKTILMLYEMERVNVSADVKGFIFSVEDFLSTFESAYVKAKTGGIPGHRESIKRGSDLKKMASNLQQSYKNNPELNDYKHVPKIIEGAGSAVKRFLDDVGAYLEEAAEYENVTPIKIWYLEDAIYAYDESGNDERRYEVNDIYKEINLEFLNDMETAGMEKAEADILLNKSDALKDSGNIIDLFSAFWSSTEARMKYGNIEKIYIGHNLNSEGCAGDIKCSHEYYGTFNEIVNNKNNASNISENLMGSILKYLAVIAFILLIILFIFQRSYSSYKADAKDAKLGRELGLDKI